MIARAEDLQPRTFLERVTSPRTIGIVGIALGVVAFWLALPPVTVRTAPLPVAAP